MTTKRQLEKKQEELDAIKWCDSELSRDTCGTYNYCVKCDKTKEYPCATAYYAFNSTAAESKGELKVNVELSALALRLQALRIAKNLSIKQAASRCKISEKKLFEYENDKDVPTEDTLKRILSVLEKR
ncbi:MAG: helix-turn-helix transcriptional regulator [Eubacterium sp.]|nr:helix-turn-helix transcriptional regulator [Eubacterium sp.]